MVLITVVGPSKLFCYTKMTTSRLAMAGKQAKILSLGDVNDLLVFASCTRHPLRNRVIVLLAAKAGLRAGEIANLTWDMVLDPTGDVRVGDRAARCCGQERQRPIDPSAPRSSAGPRRVSQSLDRHRTFHPIRARRCTMTPLSIVVWFNRAFRNIGLHGCSSHSGRRTFITRAARLVHKAGGSLRDVQLLAGHRSIQTTQRYIDGDSDVQRKLVAMI